MGIFKIKLYGILIWTGTECVCFIRYLYAKQAGDLFDLQVANPVGFFLYYYISLKNSS